jgi:2-haloacid dehalogenase
MVVFSNGSPRMLHAVLASAGLTRFFSAVVSVHDVEAFKPSPRVYRHLVSSVGRRSAEVLLVSSNPFDVIGAMSTGLQAAWVNRTGAPFDSMAEPPRRVVSSIGLLAETL